MIYLATIGLIIIVLIIIWIRRYGGSSYDKGSKVWQNELYRRWIDDYDPYN